MWYDCRPMAILKKNAFSRRVPDLVTEELVAVLSRRASFEFKQLFDIVHENLRARNAASGGEEMLRLRAYEKLQNLVARGIPNTWPRWNQEDCQPWRRRFRPTFFFLAILTANGFPSFKSQPNWRPVYLDESTVIYLRKGYGDPIPDLNYDLLAAKLGIPPTLLSDLPAMLRASPAFGKFPGRLHPNPKLPQRFAEHGNFLRLFWASR